MQTPPPTHWQLTVGPQRLSPASFDQTLVVSISDQRGTLFRAIPFGSLLTGSTAREASLDPSREMAWGSLLLMDDTEVRGLYQFSQHGNTDASWFCDWAIQLPITAGEQNRCTWVSVFENRMPNPMDGPHFTRSELPQSRLIVSPSSRSVVLARMLQARDNCDSEVFGLALVWYENGELKVSPIELGTDQQVLRAGELSFKVTRKESGITPPGEYTITPVGGASLMPAFPIEIQATGGGGPSQSLIRHAGEAKCLVHDNLYSRTGWPERIVFDDRS